MLQAPLTSYSLQQITFSGLPFWTKILARDFIFLIIPFNLNGVIHVTWLKVIFSKKSTKAGVGKHFFLWVQGMLHKKSMSYYIKEQLGSTMYYL